MVTVTAGQTGSERVRESARGTERERVVGFSPIFSVKDMFFIKYFTIVRKIIVPNVQLSIFEANIVL